ncbi:MAG: TatD family hydrolase [Gammaproteobacteria bacterium]|nr:TatD family hydrolase [Gammaproteobacteria bacterium]
MLIDTHCHLDLPVFDDDRDAILSRCVGLGIKRIIVPAIEKKSWQTLIALCRKNQMLAVALGLHPVFIEQHQESDLDLLDTQLGLAGVIAVGEIGLDYFIKTLDKKKQETFFTQQLELAKKHHLPVILHVRKAHDEVLQFLKNTVVKGGIVHAFNGSIQHAGKYIELGFKLGFGGTLTYENAHKVHALAKQLPIESLVLETDAPDMVVASHRGERNSPEYLTECLAALAKLRGESKQLLAEQTTANAIEVLGLENVL